MTVHFSHHDGSFLLTGSTVIQDYFEVPLAYPSIAPTHASAVSTPCNNVTDTSLVAWIHDGNIFYKRSGFGGVGTTGYSYKQNPVTAVSNTPVTDGLQVFPNPANDHITISSSGETDRYVIKDMLGREIRSGTLTGDLQQVNIHNAVPGNYIVTFYKDGEPVCNKLITKN